MINPKRVHSIHYLYFVLLSHIAIEYLFPTHPGLRLTYPRAQMCLLNSSSRLTLGRINHASRVYIASRCDLAIIAIL